MGKRPETARFGPYELIEELAVGGMAEVFLASHHALDGVLRDVVIKRMLAQFSDDAEFRSMFLHEARLMAALSHPNIAQIYDVGRDDVGRVYLVMEYIRGPTLCDLLYTAERGADGKVPRPFAIAVGLAVAEALRYVHTRLDAKGRPLGIVHRDLNPANVMVTHDGAVKLIDFGIAKAATSRVQTAMGMVKGTHGYMAPEQIRAVAVDQRADVFNLGVILYELLLGHHPFESENRGAQMLKVVEGRWTPPSVYDPEFPAPLTLLLTQCLETDRDLRLGDMAALIERLATYGRENELSVTLSEVGAVVSALVPSSAPSTHLMRQGVATPLMVDMDGPTAASVRRDGEGLESTEPTLVQPLVDPMGTTEVTRLAPASGDEADPTAVRASMDQGSEVDEADEDTQEGESPRSRAPDEDFVVGQYFSLSEASGGARRRGNWIGQRLIIVLGLAVVGLSAYLVMLLSE
jgi:serine/threonine protein kinase